MNAEKQGDRAFKSYHNYIEKNIDKLQDLA